MLDMLTQERHAMTLGGIAFIKTLATSRKNGKYLSQH